MRPSKPRAVRRREARRWLGVGAISLGLHAAIGVALLTTIRPAPTLVEPPIFEIALLRPARPTAPESPAAGPPAAPRSPSPLTTRAPTADVAAAPTPSVPIVAPPAGIVAPPGFTARGLTGGGESLRQAARQGAGCLGTEVVRLTKAERAACAERLGARSREAPLYAALDPAKKAAFDGDCKKDDAWCLYRTGEGPYPGLLALFKGR